MSIVILTFQVHFPLEILCYGFLFLIEGEVS